MLLRSSALLFLLTISQWLFSQTPACNPPDAPPAPSCATACIYCEFINGYSGTTIGQTASMVPNFCGTIENDQWFGFIAGATSATFSVTPSSCSDGDGVQIALYPACGANALACNVGCNNCGGVVQSITVNNMVIGNNYFLVIDGYAGDGCNFTVAVNPPAAVNAPMPGTPGAITGPATVCPGATVQYCIPQNTATNAYQWTIPADATINNIAGPGPITLTGNAGRCANIKFGTTPGPVQVCVKPVNSCFQGTQVCTTVTISTPPTATIAGSTVVCPPGATSVTIPVTFTGNPNFSITYKVDGGPNITISNITANPYNLVVTAINTVTIVGVTGAGGCAGTASGTFTINHQPASITGQPTNPLCGGANTGSINVAPVNGQTPFNYAWTPAQGNTNNPMNLAPGTYTVTATSADNCTATMMFTLAAPPALTAAIGTPTVANCTNPTGGGATATSGGGTPTVGFVWSDGTVGNTLTGAGPGTFTVTATDANSCTAMAMVTIIGNFTPPNAVASTPGVVNCTTPSATLSGAGSATGAGIIYQWTTADGNISGPTNTINTTASLPGTYEILVTNNLNGCTAMASVTVAGSLDLPTAVANSLGEITCTTSSVMVDGTGSSTGTFTYLWLASGGGNIVSGGTTLMPTVNMAGTYTITVTDVSNGCTAVAVTAVTADIQTPTAIISPPLQINCDNPTVNLDAGGSTNVQPGATYNWSGPSIVSGQGTSVIEVDLPGNYGLTITNPNGCTAVTTVAVVKNITPPIAVASTTGQVSCTTPSVPLFGNGSSSGSNISYEWGTNNGQIDGSTTSLNTMAGLPGTYTITVTNNTNGCTATASVIVTGSQDFPAAQAQATGQIDCITATMTLDGTGSSVGAGFQYQWTGPGIVSGATTLMPVVNQGGTYTLVVTNVANGCSADIQVTVNQDITQPLAQIIPPLQLNCLNATITLDATISTYESGATFSWTTTGTGHFVSGQNSPEPIVDQPGVYTLIITNPNGCTDIESVTIILNNTLPIANAATVGQVNCTNPSVPLLGTGSSVGGNISYEWSTGNGDINGLTNVINTTAGAPGLYQILVTNNTNGCTALDDVQVNGNTTPPTATATTNGQIDCTTTTVSISGAGSSVGPSFKYQWTTIGGSFVSGQTSLSPIVNAGGVYNLLITNLLNGCTAETSVIVEENKQLPIPIIANPDELNCFNAVVTIDASGSQLFGSSDFLWTTAPPGNFISSTNNQTVTVDHAGTYLLKITDNDNGCTATQSVIIVLNNTLPTANAGPNGQLTCPDPIANIGGNSTIAPDISYFWGTNNGNFVGPIDQPTANVDAPGTYLLVLQNNSNGCTAEDEVVITSNITPPIVNAGADKTLSCLMPQLQLSGAGSATGASITYLWTASSGGNIVSGASNLMPVINATGTYTLLVTNNLNGCTATDFAVVNANIAAPIAVANVSSIISCANPTVSVSGNGSSSGAGFTYLWDTPDGNILSGATTLNATINEPGSYSLIVTNTANGCSTTANIIAIADASVPIAQAEPPGDLNCATTILTIDGTQSSTGPDFSFVWTTIGGNFVSNQDSLNPKVNKAGSYILTITNLNSNCTATATVVIDQNIATPPADAGPPKTLNCLVDTLEIGFVIPPTDTNLVFNWTTIGGNFVAGKTTTNPKINKPGTYNLLVFNKLNKCSASAAVIISQDITNPTALVAAGGELTCTQTTLLLAGAGSSTGPNFQYNWTATNGGSITSGGTTLAPTVSAAGNYFLEILNTQNGCTATASTDVTQDANLPTAIAATPGLLSCKISEITLSGAGSTTGATIQYLWTTTNGNVKSGATTLFPVVNKIGEYFLKVENTDNNCETTFSVFVSEDKTPPIADAGATATIDCLAPALVLDGSGSSTGAEFTYLWTTLDGKIESNETTTNPIVSKAGTYKVLIINTLNGCTATDDVIVQKDVNAPNISFAPPATLDCDSPTSLIDASASTNNANILITWTPPAAGSFVSGETTLQPVVNTPGGYILNLTNTQNGCYDEITIQVAKDVVPPISDAGSPYILTCIALTQTIGGTNSSTGQNIDYQWITSTGNIVSGKKLAKAVVNQPGIYVLEITNITNGCTAIDTVFIDQDIQNPTADAGAGSQIDCQSPEITLAATGSVGGNFNYDWTTSGGNFTSPTTILQPTVNAAGTYTLVVIDQNNGCTATDFVEIIAANDLPTALAGLPTTLTCAILTANLNGAGSSIGAEFEYHWTTIDGQILAGDSTLTPKIGAPGTYQLAVTNTVSVCTSFSSVVVAENVVPPVAEAGATQTLTCAVTNLSLAGMGSGSTQIGYFWTTNGGSILSGNTTATPIVSLPGIYNLLITNGLNGCTATDSVQVLADVNLPTAVILPPVTLNCTVKTATLDASQGTTTGTNMTYSWTTSNGNFVSKNNLIAIIDKKGDYQLLVKNNATGCSVTANVTVLEDIQIPTAAAGADISLTCTAPTATLTGAGSSAGANFSYNWAATNGGNIVSGGTTLSPKIDKPGTYTIVVTNATNTCTASDAVAALPDAGFPISIILPPAELTCIKTDQILNATGSSNAANFTLKWTTIGGNFTAGQTTLTPSVDAPGVYKLLITNTLNGCTVENSVTVLENIALPTADAGTGFQLTCSVTDGTLNGTATPAQVTANWTTLNGKIESGANSLLPKVSKAGNYTLLVTSTDNGCTKTDNVEVTEETNKPTDISVLLTVPRCDGNVGKIEFSVVNGGIQPYLYSIDGGLNYFSEAIFQSIEPGAYTLVVQDVHGCTWSEPLDVPAPIEPTVSILPEITVELGESLVLDADLGAFPIDLVDIIEWTPLDFLRFKSLAVPDLLRPTVVLPLKNTRYKIVVVSDAGCTATAFTNIKVEKTRHVYIPNAISPWSNNGQNDKFTIYADPKQVIEIQAFELFDRWGDKIWAQYNFQPNLPAAGWDAVVRGQKLTPGVFVYWAKILFIDGKVELYKGDVTIVK